jgi:predicted nuclease of predicted toxin-antitoxin system
LKILIDAQLPPGLKILLTAAGHEAHHVVDVGLRDASDAMVWDYAVAERTVIFAKDEDFAARRSRVPHGRTIVWLRVGNCSRAALAYWLNPLLPGIETFVQAGEAVIEVR